MVLWEIGSFYSLKGFVLFGRGDAVGVGEVYFSAFAFEHASVFLLFLEGPVEVVGLVGLNCFVVHEYCFEG